MIRGVTRTLGSPADLFLQLFNDEGHKLAEIDDVKKSEGMLDHRFSSDGSYTLSVEDLVHAGGPAYAYRVQIAPFDNWFSLSMEKETLNVPSGGTVTTKVTAFRRHYAGPIELFVDGAGDGVQLADNVIAKDKNETELKITFPERLGPGQWQMVRVVGKATVNETDFLSSASTLNALRRVMPQTPFPPASLLEHIAVGFGDPVPPFFELSLAEETVYFPQVVGTSRFKVLAKRLNDNFRSAIDLTVEGLPAGIEFEVKPVQDGKSEYLITQTGPADLPEGVHHIRVVGTATFQNQTKKVAVDKIPFQVVKPLVVHLEPQGPIRPGGQQKMKIKVRRFGEQRYPVVLRWKEGPAQIFVPVQVTVPAKKDELEIQLAAAEDATVGTSGNLIAVATTRLRDQELTVESTPVALEVAAP